jgi:hypothetical protein
MTYCSPWAVGLNDLDTRRGKGGLVSITRPGGTPSQIHERFYVRDSEV